jgi:signal transduction histidine kinase
MKLLTRTVRDYVIFSALLLLVCTPLFYFSIQTLTIRDKDRELRSHKAEFYELIPHLKTDEDLKFFGIMNDEFVLTETEHPVLLDSIFSSSISINDEDHPYRILRSGVTINGKHHILQIQESMVTTADLVSAIVTVQIILIAFLLVGFVLINRKLSKTIWNPFYTILDRLKKYQIDKDTTIDLPRSSTAEFRDLSLAISHLVIRNHETFQSQKEFTENASHELQTPLAISRTKLELLAQTKELTQEQAELVESLSDAIDRLSRLNKNLLLLSKIENRQFFETGQIEIGSVVTKCVDFYKRQVADKNINITYATSEPVFIEVNPILFDVLITNLISNAFRHADEFSTIAIEWSKNHITISNAGNPLENPEKIFQRFHRESRTTMGHGLGLSIVKKVCDVAGFSIDYRYTSGRHQFAVAFGNSPGS